MNDNWMFFVQLIDAWVDVFADCVGRVEIDYVRRVALQ